MYAGTWRPDCTFFPRLFSAACFGLGAGRTAGLASVLFDTAVLLALDLTLLLFSLAAVVTVGLAFESVGVSACAAVGTYNICIQHSTELHVTVCSQLSTGC